MSKHSINCAKSTIESIIEMVERLNAARTYDYPEELEDQYDEDSISEEIYNYPLEVTVRTGWVSPGSEDPDWYEYQILITTGGPAVRIIGDLNTYNEPDNVILQHQDWFESWTVYPLSGYERKKLIEFARHFYFGG